jgi:nitroreductase
MVGAIEMDLFDLLQARHSVRSFRDDAVPSELVTRILEAVRTAPTAGNFQAYEIYLVTGAARMKSLAEATFHPDWIAQAPMALVVCTHAARCQYDPKEYWAQQDASIAAMLAHLAIVDLGLATCWVGAFDPAKLAETIAAAEGHVPLALLPVGYANESPQETTRRALEEFVHRRE